MSGAGPTPAGAAKFAATPPGAYRTGVVRSAPVERVRQFHGSRVAVLCCGHGATCHQPQTHTLQPMKVVVLGQGGVGKSCCTLRYLFGTFQAGYDPTVGASAAAVHSRRPSHTANILSFDSRPVTRPSYMPCARICKSDPPISLSRRGRDHVSAAYENHCNSMRVSVGSREFHCRVELHEAGACGVGCTLE